MRNFRIFILHFEHITEHAPRSFVYFLLSLYNPLLFLLFWRGVSDQSSANMSSITSYYFILVVASASLMAHVEEDIATQHIAEGGLVKYLMKPFSYYWFTFFEEIHYRLLQGVFGIIAVIFFTWIFGPIVKLPTDPLILILASMSAILAIFLSFTFKSIVAFSAFWITDMWGLFELMEIMLIFLAGFLMPLDLLPQSFQTVAFSLPFSYMIYFPVIAFQGKLSHLELIQTLSIQVVWLVILLTLYQYVWTKGIRKFSAVGQ